MPWPGEDLHAACLARSGRRQIQSWLLGGQVYVAELGHAFSVAEVGVVLGNDDFIYFGI